MVGERRLDLRVAKLNERSVPLPRGRRLERERGNLVGVDLSELTVHPEKRRQHLAAVRRRRHLQLWRVFDDLRHDAVEEFVVELDAALALRLLEDVVDER